MNARRCVDDEEKSPVPSAFWRRKVNDFGTHFGGEAGTAAMLPHPRRSSCSGAESKNAGASLHRRFCFCC